MTIYSSLTAGVAGLLTNAHRLGAISDNIANSSTQGYKRADTDFHSLVNKGLGGEYSAGGVRATTQRLVGENGAYTNTKNATDIAVRGRGLLPVTTRSTVTQGDHTDNLLLTTTGSFRTDSERYLTSTSGLVLMGWKAKADGTMPVYPRDTTQGLELIKINRNQFLHDPTTKITFAANLPATGTEVGADGSVEKSSLEYFDNLGKSQALNIEFTPKVPASGDASNAWTMTIKDSAQNNAVVGEYVLTFDDSRAKGGVLKSVTTKSGGAYSETTGKMTLTVAGGPIDFTIGKLGEKGAITQLSDAYSLIKSETDGSQVGSISSVEIDEKGFVIATFDNGITRTVYQVPMVDVPNPNGLYGLDSQTFKPSLDSGPFFLWDAGKGPAGEIKGYALEESTVDVASEMIDMIQTQRAYSSNAKVIQTLDEMMQETTNIKR